MSDWTSRLRQASFRGVPFGVALGDRIIGRRLAVHEFPGRDTPYPEDMGRRTRNVTVQGFLIEDSAVYGGGDVLVQRSLLEAAAEAAGPGELIHPTKGRLLVSLQQLSVRERAEEGRYFELNFEFVEAGDASGLAVLVSTVSAVLGAADAAMDVVSGLFGTASDDAVGTSSALGNTATTALQFTTTASALGGDVAGAFNAGSPDSSATLTSASATFSDAAAGLGVVTGAGVATAAATTGVIQALSATTAPGAGIDLLGGFAGGLT